MWNILKKIRTCAVVLPFLFLALSFCCVGMANASGHPMDCCASIVSSNTVQPGLNFHGCAQHSAKCQCEQLTETYDKAGLKSVDSHKTFLNNPKAITFANQIFTHGALAYPPFFNYQSPPKIVQNSLPLYLQLSVLRI